MLSKPAAKIDHYVVDLLRMQPSVDSAKVTMDIVDDEMRITGTCPYCEQPLRMIFPWKDEDGEV